MKLNKQAQASKIAEGLTKFFTSYGDDIAKLVASYGDDILKRTGDALKTRAGNALVKEIELGGDVAKAWSSLDDVAKKAISLEESIMLKASKKGIQSLNPKEQQTVIKLLSENQSFAAKIGELLSKTPELATQLANYTSKTLQVATNSKELLSKLKLIVPAIDSISVKLTEGILGSRYALQTVRGALLKGSIKSSIYTFLVSQIATGVTELYRAIFTSSDNIKSIVENISDKLRSYSFNNKVWINTVDLAIKNLNKGCDTYCYTKENIGVKSNEENVKNLDKLLAYEEAGRKQLLIGFDFLLSKEFEKLYKQSLEIDNDFFGSVVEFGKQVVEQSAKGQILDITIIQDLAKQGKSILELNSQKVNPILDKIDQTILTESNKKGVDIFSDVEQLKPQTAYIINDFVKIAKTLKLVK